MLILADSAETEVADIIMTIESVSPPGNENNRLGDASPRALVSTTSSRKSEDHKRQQVGLSAVTQV